MPAVLYILADHTLKYSGLTGTTINTVGHNAFIHVLIKQFAELKLHICT